MAGPGPALAAGPGARAPVGSAAPTTVDPTARPRARTAPPHP